MQINSRSIDFFIQKINNLWVSNYVSCLIKIPHLCSNTTIIEKIFYHIEKITKNENNIKNFIPIIVNRDFNSTLDYVKFIHKKLQTKIENLIDFDENLDSSFIFREIIDDLLDRNCHLILINDNFHRLWRLGDLAFIGQLRDAEINYEITSINFSFADYLQLKEHYHDNQLVNSDYGSFHAILEVEPLSENEIMKECSDLELDIETISQHLQHIPKIDFLASRYLNALRINKNQKPQSIIDSLNNQEVKNNFNELMNRIDYKDNIKNNIDRRDLMLEAEFASFPFINFIFDKVNKKFVINSLFVKNLLEDYLESSGDIINKLILQDEDERLEFKSSYRYDFEKKSKNNELIKKIFRTIVSMMNTSGGYIILGRTDVDKKVIGIDLKKEEFVNFDKMEQNIQGKFNEYIGKKYSELIKIKFENINNVTLLIIHVRPNLHEPIFLIEQETKTYIYKQGSTTHSFIDQKELIDVICKRFPDYIKNMTN